MKMMKTRRQGGAATLLYLMIMAVVISLLSAITFSRLMGSLKRSQSQADTVVATYEAESEINDLLARLTANFIPETSFPISYSKNIGGTTINVKGTQSGQTQNIIVTSQRSFAVSRIEATRKIDSVREVDNVDMILSLDCTGSMDAGADCENCNSKPSRFDSQKDAADNFVSKLAEISRAGTYSGRFNLGIVVFGVDSKWLTYNGVEVTPKSGLTYDQIRAALAQGFGSTRATSPACTGLMDATSIGTAFATSHQYFSANKKPKTKQVEIVITDGEPNSRIPYPACGPSVFCPGFPKDPQGNNYCEQNSEGWSCYKYDQYKSGPWDSDNFNQTAYDTCEPLAKDFLSCTIASKDTTIPPIQGQGVRNGARDPDVDAYAVTIFTNPPRDVVSIFNSYLTQNGYYNATRASQLKNILNNVLNEILRDRSTITIKRTPPSL
jgi:type II secretory pathway pseudopilin PulG